MSGCEGPRHETGRLKRHHLTGTHLNENPRQNGPRMSETETPEPIALRDRIANGAFLCRHGDRPHHSLRRALR